ncbi:MAG: alpha-L-arabinofuranosidase C-terminal domain-containing protein [Chitinophagaceae bacterium]
MKVYIFLLTTFSFLFVSAQNTVVINADQGKEIINKNIYGHFAEHLGHCIYDGFYVGDTNKKIPNKDGVRLDVINVLKKLKVPVLRWPGGCFADTYHWRDGIGPKNKRPAMLNVWWGGVTEDNSFGTHDFLNMCELLGTEPYLSGNIGSGTVQELSDWVKYVDHKEGSSPMPILRAQNGRKEPWHVKYWGVGNEAWGCGGNMKPEYYINIYRQYATFMNAGGTDNLFRIASGANSSDYNWTEVLMRDIPQNMIEGIALHHYAVIDWNKKSSATAFTDQEYFTTMMRACLMEELIQRHTTIMDKYDPTKKIALIVDEWGGWYDVEPGTNAGFLYQQNTMRDAMIAGVTLNIFNNHCDRVRMANLAQTINVLQAVILTDGEKMILTPTYHVMEMYNVHQDATMLPVSISSNDYTMGTEKLKAISISASRNKKGATHISLVNIDAINKQEIKIDVRGINATSVTGRILTSEKLQNYNSFNNPEKIKPAPFNSASMSNNTLKLTVPPFSVVVLELK